MKDNQSNFSANLKPSQDDIALRQRQLHTKRTASSNTQATSTNSGWLIVALFIAVLASAVAGFAVWQLLALQEKFNKADESLFKLDTATQTLQESVSQTGAKASLSAGALKDLIKENNQEIRKLWFVANERNKKLISSNQSLLKKLEAADAQLKKDIESAQTELQGRLDASSGKLKNAVLKLNKETSMIPEMSLLLGQNEEQLQQLEKKINALKRALKKLEAEQTVKRQSKP